MRGIRNGMDYEYEENMAQINQKDICGLDTIYVRAGELGNVSSSLVMELLKHGKDISKDKRAVTRLRREAERAG